MVSNSSRLFPAHSNPATPGAQAFALFSGKQFLKPAMDICSPARLTRTWPTAERVYSLLLTFVQAKPTMEQLLRPTMLSLLVMLQLQQVRLTAL